MVIGGDSKIISTFDCSSESVDDVPLLIAMEISAWVTFVAPSSGCVEIDFKFLEGKGLFDDDAGMAIYQSNSGDLCNSFPFEDVACNDNASASNKDPKIVVDGTAFPILVPGKQYYLLVGGMFGDEVTGTIEITDPCGM